MKILALLVALLAIMSIALWYQLIPPLSLALLVVGGTIQGVLVAELTR